MQPPVPPVIPTPPDWQMIGSFADWTTAAVALLAFVIAAIAARATLKTNNAQQAQLAMQIEQQKYAQAAQVTFWLTGGTDIQPEQAHILNASRPPVYAAALLFKEGDNYRCVWFERVLSPMADGAALTQKFTLTGSINHDHTFFIFSDSGGQHWKRNGWGTLTEVSKEEEANSPLTQTAINYVAEKFISDYSKIAKKKRDSPKT